MLLPLGPVKRTPFTLFTVASDILHWLSNSVICTTVGITHPLPQLAVAAS